MKIFVTKSYFENSKKHVGQISDALADIRAEKYQAYTQDTNSWHDNFAYEHLTRQEKQTEKQLTNLMCDLDNMQIVDIESCDRSADVVGLYCWADVVMENLSDGAETKSRLGIVPLGDEDIAHNIYAYSMPIVYPLIGLSIGGEANICMPAGEIQITVLEITKMAKEDLQ